MGILVIIGSFLIHFILGTLYLWGGIAIYIVSYMRIYNPEFTLADGDFVFPIIGTFMSVGMIFAY